MKLAFLRTHKRHILFVQNILNTSNLCPLHSNSSLLESQIGWIERPKLSVLDAYKRDSKKDESIGINYIIEGVYKNLLF